MIKDHVFREYDIRGIVPDDLDQGFCERLGKAYGTYLVRSGCMDVVVGRDNRLSSTPFRDALVEGLRSTGLCVIDAGIVPTPVLYYALFHYKFDAGVMITASHNPPEYNGFKLCIGERTLYGDEIRMIGHLMREGDFCKGSGRVRFIDPRGSYVDRILQRLEVSRLTRVAIDCGNGTCGDVVERIANGFPNLRLRKLYFDSDGSFPHHLPDPSVPGYLKALIDVVTGEGLDLGIAFDGDGDRVGAVDRDGRVIFPDELLIIFARETLKKWKGGQIIFDVKCSTTLIDAITRSGGEPVMWKTGHSLIKEKIRELHAPFGGEMSGHIYFAKEYFAFDDGLYAGFRLLDIISRHDRGISGLLKDVPKMVSTPEIRIDCPEGRKFEVVKAVCEYFKDRFECIDLDGVRIEFDGGWGLVRASNTQAKVVLRFEAKTPERLQEIRGLVEGKLREVMRGVRLPKY